MYNHISLNSPIASGASVDPTSQVSSAMLMMQEIEKYDFRVAPMV
jgi:hypothetical protein